MRAFRAQVAEWEQAGAAALWHGRIGTHDGQHFVLHDSALQRFVGTPRMTSPAAHLVRRMEQLPQPVRFQWQTTVQPLQARQALAGSCTAPSTAPNRSTTKPCCWPCLRPRLRPCWRPSLLRPPPCTQRPHARLLVGHGALRPAGATARGWLLCRAQPPALDRARQQQTRRSGPETWLLHASHAWSEAHVHDEAAAVTAALLQAFTQLGGPDPASVQATAHRWLYADTAPPLNVNSWWDLRQAWACAATGCTTAPWKAPGSVAAIWPSACTPRWQRTRHKPQAQERTMHRKPYLPEKPCQCCGRPFTWRKKWARCGTR